MEHAASQCGCRELGTHDELCAGGEGLRLRVINLPAGLAFGAFFVNVGSDADDVQVSIAIGDDLA